ncbi:hypothetical protein [Clostridium saccharoperbutylacetonicum]|uniref:hypothetical protein n=1 Tax=Clostridium saccharoperbutylacetonicum TaxID=36745 RepID=UPI0039ED7E6F
MKLKYPKDPAVNKPISKSINVELFEKDQKYDAVIKIVGTLFSQCKDKLNESNYEGDKGYTNSKKIINQFEKVMSCIRYEITEKKDIFKDNKDNLNLLMEISESINLSKEFQKLLDDYLDVMNKKSFEINIEIDEKILVQNGISEVFSISDN